MDLTIQVETAETVTLHDPTLSLSGLIGQKDCFPEDAAWEHHLMKT